jgi:hypothetical protein
MPDVTSYITDESNRLDSKLKSVDAAYNAQMRNAVLNDSYRKRYAKYVEIITILILAVITYLAISYLQSKFPSLPAALFDGLTIIIVSLVVLYLLFAFFELYTRSNMNYDEIALPPQDVSGVTMNSAMIGNTIAAARSVNNGAVCTGPTCCTPGTTKWDDSLKSCVSISTFTTLDQAYEYKQIAAPMTGQLPVVNYSGIGSSASAEPIVSGTSVPFSQL